MYVCLCVLVYQKQGEESLILPSGNFVLFCRNYNVVFAPTCTLLILSYQIINIPHYLRFLINFYYYIAHSNYLNILIISLVYLITLFLPVLLNMRSLIFLFFCLTDKNPIQREL